MEQHPRPPPPPGEGCLTGDATGVGVGCATGAGCGASSFNHFPEQEPSQRSLLSWHHELFGWLHSSKGGQEQQPCPDGVGAGTLTGGEVGDGGGVGGGVVGGVGPEGRIVISAQFQNCSGFPVPVAPVGSNGYVHVILLPPFAWSYG